MFSQLIEKPRSALSMSATQRQLNRMIRKIFQHNNVKLIETGFKPMDETWQ